MRADIGSICTRGLLILIAPVCLAGQSLAGADNAPSVAQQTPSQGTIAAQNGFAPAKSTNEATASPSPDGSVGSIRGITRNPKGIPLPAAKVTLRSTTRTLATTTT